MTYSCINTTTKSLLLSEVQRADRLFSRIKGLLGRRTLGPGQGMWLIPCKQVHTAFMRFALDVVFLDRNLEVIAMYSGLAPWRVTRFFLQAHSVLEASGGALLRRIDSGHRLVFEKIG